MKAADRGSKVTQPPLGSSINLIESGFSWTRILIEEKKEKWKRQKCQRKWRRAETFARIFKHNSDAWSLIPAGRAAQAGRKETVLHIDPSCSPGSRIINISMAPVNRLFHSSGRQMAGASLTSIDPSEPRGKIQRETEKCWPFSPIGWRRARDAIRGIRCDSWRRSNRPPAPSGARHLEGCSDLFINHGSGNRNTKKWKSQENFHTEISHFQF